MWSDKGNESAGGGYFGADEFKSSPGGGGSDEKKVYKAQNCVPVTIGHIHSSSEDSFKIGKHAEAHVVTILGRLIKKDTDSTKLSYTIDDGTGSINCFDFKFNDGDMSAVRTDVEVNQYYRVFGSVRVTEGEHHILAFRIQPLESVNEITMHILEVIYAPAHLDELECSAHLKRPGMAAAPDNSMRNSMADVGGNYGGGGGRSNVSGFTRNEQAVYEAVKNFKKQEIGIHEAAIPEALPMKLDKNEIHNILDFLTNEGHIYSTTDTSHYRTTDA